MQLGAVHELRNAPRRALVVPMNENCKWHIGLSSGLGSSNSNSNPRGGEKIYNFLFSFG